MSLKSKIEAIIYAAEEPVTVEHILAVLKDVAPEELAAAAVVDTPGETPVEDLAATAPSAATPENPRGEASPAAASAEAGTEQAPPAQPAPLDPKAREKAERAEQRARIRGAIEQLIAEYDAGDRGMEIRAIAGGYRMGTRPEHHDAVRAFAKSLKPPVRLSLQALETLAVIAYKQPMTVPEISEIRGVDSGGVIGTLLDRKLITTAGRKQVVGRPILYKTTKEFLLHFGLKDVSELPSMEEFEKLASDQADLFARPAGESGTATGMRESSDGGGSAATAALAEGGASPDTPTDEPPAQEPPSDESPVEEPPQEQPDLKEPPSHDPPQKAGEPAPEPAESPELA